MSKNSECFGTMKLEPDEWTCWQGIDFVTGKKGKETQKYDTLISKWLGFAGFIGLYEEDWIS